MDSTPIYVLEQLLIFMNLPQFMPFYGISSQFSLIESLIPNRPTGPQWSRPWVPWVPWQIVRTPSFGADAEVTISIGVEAPSHTIIQTHKQVVEPGKNGGTCCHFFRENWWIGERENRNRKPWILPWNIGFSANVTLKQSIENLVNFLGVNLSHSCKGAPWNSWMLEKYGSRESMLVSKLLYCFHITKS